jgi:uncharacterized protein with HEPN domain
MDRRDEILLEKIIYDTERISNSLSKIDCSYFLHDENTQDIVCMNLVKIGEKIKLLSNETKKANPDIDWKRISGLRDIVAHRYETLKWDWIWETANNYIPNFRKKVFDILKKI